MTQKENSFINHPEESGDYQEIPFSDMLLSIINIVADIFANKPFNIPWKEEKMEYFLSKLGYIIIERNNKNGIATKFAVKPDNPQIPDDESGYVQNVFNSEIQDILINYLLKLKEA